MAPRFCPAKIESIHESKADFFLILSCLGHKSHNFSTLLPHQTFCVSFQSSKFAFSIQSQDHYDGKVFRPTSAPSHRIISQMYNEEPLFRKTSNQKNIDDIKLAQLNSQQVTDILSPPNVHFHL